MATKKGAAEKSKERKVASQQETVGQKFRMVQQAVDWVKNLAGQTDQTGAKCEEASFLSREKYIPCGAPASAVVWHEKDRRAYKMCAACADHNTRNRGGVLLKTWETALKKGVESKVKIGPLLVIQAGMVLEVKALQQEKKTLAGKLEEIEKVLKAREAPIILMIENHIPFGPGCPPCAVDATERRVPKWKEIAVGLAQRFLGLAPEVYEAQVLTETAAKVYKHLVINGST